jgi:hypothetical protein
MEPQAVEVALPWASAHLTQPDHASRSRKTARWPDKWDERPLVNVQPQVWSRVSEPLDEIIPSIALAGWRDRSTGTMHLEACPDFETLGAESIEDAVWRSEGRYERLCPVCFPSTRAAMAAPPRKRIEPYGY